MKKLFTACFVLLFFGLEIFAGNFYLSLDYSIEERDDLMVGVQRAGKLQGISVVDCETVEDEYECFPRLVLSVEADYDNPDEFELNAAFYPDKKSDAKDFRDSFLNLPFVSSRKDFLAAYIEAFFPLLKNLNAQSGQKNPPEILDTRSITINKSTKRSYPANVAPRADYSFVLRRGDIIEEYSPNWELLNTYTNQLPAADGTDEWEPGCYDGKNIVFGNASYPGLFKLTDANKLENIIQYKVPSAAMVKLKYESSGNPYLQIFDDGYKYYFLKEGKELSVKNDLGFVYVNFAEAGPNETVWVGRTDGAIYVFSKDGKLKKIIQTLEEDRTLTGVLEDGSFLARVKNNLECYNPDGQKIWTYKCPAGFEYNLFLSARNGMYYFYNNSEKTITRMADSDAKLSGTLSLVKGIGSKLAEANMKETAEIYLKTAETYYKEKAWKSALNYYNLYLQISPANTKAAEKKLNCEIVLNKQAAKEKTESALNLYDEYGEETAKADYQEAMKLLEKLKKQVPWDEEVQSLYAELKNTFYPGESVAKVQRLSLEVKEVDLTALYPALISVYSKMPSGFMQVKNTSRKAIKNITVASNIRKYMDYPSTSEVVSELKAGEEVRIPISSVLNEKVLQINEATPVQMQFTIKWEEEGKSYSTNITRAVTIYKKSALSWADTAMASCFVLPNDPSVSDFVFAALNSKLDTIFTTNLTKAIQISDAIGSIPLNYISDPVTPATQVIDNEYAIDTIRFPSETLKLKGGDCDDMTTLFCSLLESTNIDTAFVTTTGHIFAAFNTGLDYNSIWENMDKDHLIINVEEKAWIPVECTSLSQGFAKAWENASKLISKEEYEVTTLASAWKTYSPVPAESSKASVALKADALNKMNSKNRSDTLKCITRAMEKTDLAKASGNELNQLAKLYHSIGNDDKAIEVLVALTNKEPKFYKGYSNLARLYEMKGDTKKARACQQKAEAYSPKNAAKKGADSRASNSSAAADAWDD